jgi:23S rRNA (cytosine1962-C5)-methyltransferase
MLFFADKPAGVSTHTSLSEAEREARVTERTDGFLEMLSSRHGKRLWPIHRLDKETTGAIAFAESSEDAERLRSAFESRSVQKRYLFLTDRKSDSTELVRESNISKQAKLYVSSDTDASNSRTVFRRIREAGRYSLWEAFPETGKPHQIRLHAEDLGIHILGDHQHNGTSFPALCLHSASFESTDGMHASPPPRYFEDLSLLEDIKLCGWLTAVDRRERLIRSGCILGWKNLADKEQTLRWIHSEGDPLRAEQLGPVVQISWFSERMPTENEWKSIHHLRELMGWNEWYFQQRGDRGKAPNTDEIALCSESLAQRWTAKERALTFEFRRDSGLSPGLFLDQRANRAFVETSVKSKKVLNLFSYTGGFSVVAAKAGAEKVVTVDVSKTFLEWAKVNFSLNGVSIEGHEFRAMDAREYLAWAAKKDLKFDWIVCDPPSFGRSTSGVFKIEKDIDDLLVSLVAVLAPQGKLLFSMNFEAWDEKEFTKRVRTALTKSKRKTRLMPAPEPDWDFEVPHVPRNMKAVIIEAVSS